jgi:hypothetical protein
MATEIALLRLKEDTDLSTPGPALTTWTETLSTVLAQPGAQRAYWGTSVETPSFLRLFIDWDSVDAHKTFMSSPAYGPFGGKLMTLLSGVEGVYHAHMTPNPPSKALGSSSSPATELLTAYFPTGYTSAQQDAFSANFAKLASIMEMEGQGAYLTASGGWCVEDEVVNPANAEVKGKAFFGAIGWKSVQAHLDFRSTEAFQKNIHLLRGAEGLLGVHVEHYVGTEVGGGK